jgi:hypothetical protein
MPKPAFKLDAAKRGTPWLYISRNDALIKLIELV